MSNTHRHLINHLPAVYHKSEDLGVLLSVFEKIFYGEDGQGQRSKKPRQSPLEPIPLVDSIAAIALLFDPAESPDDFLNWLAQWVALTSLEGLNASQKRRLIARIVPLYGIRGTKKYIKEMVEFFISPKMTISIREQGLAGLIVGSAHVGDDTRLERERPFWFQVTITVANLEKKSDLSGDETTLWEKRIRRIIDLAKPAHTLYDLDWQVQGNQTKIESIGSVKKSSA